MCGNGGQRVWIGKRGGQHGLSREMVCSLPRCLSCRLCWGEEDCQYIIDRPHCRLVVHKRNPERLVVASHTDLGTGTKPRHVEHRWRQWPAALFGWSVVVGAVVWFWVLHTPSATDVLPPLILKAVMFAAVVIGVPLVRSTWRDRGGHEPVR